MWNSDKYGIGVGGDVGVMLIHRRRDNFFKAVFVSI